MVTLFFCILVIFCLFTFLKDTFCKARRAKQKFNVKKITQPKWQNSKKWSYQNCNEPGKKAKLHTFESNVLHHHFFPEVGPKWTRSTWQPISIHFRHGTSPLRLHGHFGPVYLLQKKRWRTLLLKSNLALRKQKIAAGNEYKMNTVFP